MTETMKGWLDEARRLIFNGDRLGAAELYERIARECTTRASTIRFEDKQNKRHMMEGG